MPAKITTFSSLNINVYHDKDTGDFISLTQMAINQGGADLLNEWLKNKNTIEFLAVWEKLNNPRFNTQACDTILMQAGVNRFRLPVKKWVGETGAIGLIAKSGRYGGTFAHIDIALEFAGWLDPQLRLYVISEFKRFKLSEEKEEGLRQDWVAQRLRSKSAYRVHTDAVKETLAKNKGDFSKYIYATEADIFNLAVFGQTAADFKREHPDATGNMRDYASTDQLLVLSQIEAQNALLIRQNVSKTDRLEYLAKEAERELKLLREKPLSLPSKQKQLKKD